MMDLAHTAALLEALDRQIEGHPGYNNKFFQHCRRRRLTLSKLKELAPDYYHFIRTFPKCLAALVSAVTEEDSRFFLTGILFEEMGSGVPSGAHFKLFSRLMEGLGVASNELAAGPHFDETSLLASGMMHLYTSEDLLVALGAQYALEKKAIVMIASMRDGFLGIREALGVSMEYFDVHMVAEPKHHQLMVECVNRYLVSDREVQRLMAGARQLLDLFEPFWNRFLEACNAVAPADLVKSVDYSVPMELGGRSAEADVLRFLFNSLSSQKSLFIESPNLSQIDHNLLKINDVCGAIDAMIEDYAAKAMPSHIRVYFAYRLKVPIPAVSDDEGEEEFDGHYRFAYSRSRAGLWRPHLCVSAHSNIHHVFQSGVARAHLDTTRTGEPDNQKLADELSVYNMPIKFEGESVAVLGISSPRLGGVSEWQRPARDLGTYIEALFAKYGQELRRRRPDLDMPSLLREELDQYFSEWAIPAPNRDCFSDE